MAYTPDATDDSQPISSVKAGTAAAEFRAIKAYLKTLVIGGIGVGPDVRQTASDGSRDANGDPNFLSAGTGLALNLAATNDPLILTYAAGVNSLGSVDYTESVSADVAGVVTGLAPSNLSFINKTFGGAWDKTLAPPQYGKIFDRGGQMLIRWPGANNAVATTEDFGKAATFFGNAKLSTAVQILGLNTLACDGTGDYVQQPMTTVGRDSWEFFGSFRVSSLAAIGTVFNFGTAGFYGVLFRVTAGGLAQLFLSSNGTGWDIMAGSTGSTVIAINTTYYYRVVFDSVAGTYRVYLSNNGGAEVQELTLASTTRVNAGTLLSIGADNTGGIGFNGNIGFTGFRRWASFTSAQAAGPTVAPTFADVRADYFCIPKMKMYQVTAASTIAGTDPTLTPINKIYLGEVVTGAAAVSSVVNYAYKGYYESPWFPIVADTSYVRNHNIGAAAFTNPNWSPVNGGYEAGSFEAHPGFNTGSGGNANYRGVGVAQTERNKVNFLSDDSIQVQNSAGTAFNAVTTTGFVKLTSRRVWGGS